MKQTEVYALSGSRIRQLRIEQKKSQEDVAFSAGIDQSTYSKIERVGPQIVSWKKLEAVAEALGYVVEVSFKPKA